ncbi:hypothetical protein Pfo_028813, partial [Paulownia fortunei]
MYCSRLCAFMFQNFPWKPNSTELYLASYTLEFLSLNLSVFFCLHQRIPIWSRSPFSAPPCGMLSFSDILIWGTLGMNGMNIV